MRKVFYAPTVEAAVASARRELGENALLVDVQQVPDDRGAQDGYQVLFELDGSGLAPGVSEGTGFASREPADSKQGVAELRTELARLSSLIASLASSGAPHSRRPELTRMAAALQSYDLPPDWTHHFLNRVEQRLGSEWRDSLASRVLGEELRAAVALASCADPGKGRTVVALVGPPGAGKTTMLVKLAMHLGIAARRSTLVLTTDTYRVAAVDQLRTYASVLGLPFQMIETPRALAASLAEYRQKQLILIDTPGFSPGDWEFAREWAAMLEATPEVRTSLVLPATMRGADLRDLTRRWTLFQPHEMIVTRMDETTAYGGCVAASLDSRIPISWLGTGQNIPEDLESASPGRLFDGVVGQDLKKMTAAA
ncbi:MAG TPA: hypothetical protein VGK29_13830 [Paludibaculum sp.]|jgi:flagellar biosynthesis protein FlhF